MSGPKTVNEVAQSHGVVIHLAHEVEDGHVVQNLRGAFVAGLAMGLDKALLAIQHGDSPVPVDYAELVERCERPQDIQEAVSKFAAEVFERTTSQSLPSAQTKKSTLLRKIDLGASAAENEFTRLSSYYLETEEYSRVKRGEARLVVGRKGTGKSALFFQLRDSKRNSKQNLILDLKPEGFQLRKLRDLFAIALGEGTYEHTLIAFWDYLLRMELTRGILERDAKVHIYDHNKFEKYRALESIYKSSGEYSVGSFSERLAYLINRVLSELGSKGSGEEKKIYLSEPEVTEVVYGPDFRPIEKALSDYLRSTGEIWILFDNLDKGWPAYGLDDSDILIIRTLLEATRKIERWAQRSMDCECHAAVFLRNDVFELLIEGTSDRGKESKVLLDWADPDVLLEMVRRRIAQIPEVSDKHTFDDVWRRMCVPVYRGEDSARYLVDRCLMRPRFLLNLIGHCKSFAVNLGHERIETDDIKKGLKAYSNDLLTDVSLEIRDVAPYAEDILYAFIGAPEVFDLDYAISVTRDSEIEVDKLQELIDLLLWYGFLGMSVGGGQPKYIYDVSYHLKALLALRRQNRGSNANYVVNPAFWPVLQVGE